MPNDISLILESLSSAPRPSALSRVDLGDKINAGWLGRIAGCNVGKPVEWGHHWTSARIRDYLVRAGAYPLSDYIPVIGPMPECFALTECWPETTRGHVKGSARDDDIDYTILALHLIESRGMQLMAEDVGSAWLSLLPLERVYTAERATYINLVNGHVPPECARRRNPYREWIGAQIRGDLFGCVNSGRPWEAARMSYQDARLSHVGNGIYGEMWSAALMAAAFTAATAIEAVVASLRVVLPQSRLAEALEFVLDTKSSGVTWERGFEAIQERYGHYSWVHTINNAALVAAALIWSDDDFVTVVGRVVMSGWDTDSNGATVGSVMGVLGGMSQLPEHLINPLRDRTRAAFFGFDNSRISDLAHRTARLAADLA